MAPHENLNRRQFNKWLSAASLIALGTIGSAASRRLLSSSKSADQPAPVAALDELELGGYKLFRHPVTGEPCILIRLAAEEYVAFSQSCTHLKCPVHFRADKKQLVCPCHEGYFSAQDGSPLAGPPKRPLQKFLVEIRQDRIWVV
jgi:arsenite oxidase small subunit